MLSPTLFLRHAARVRYGAGLCQVALRKIPSTVQIRRGMKTRENRQNAIAQVIDGRFEIRHAPIHTGEIEGCQSALKQKRIIIVVFEVKDCAS